MCASEKGPGLSYSNDDIRCASTDIMGLLTRSKHEPPARYSITWKSQASDVRYGC
jgi:hypothetical protein